MVFIRDISNSSLVKKHMELENVQPRIRTTLIRSYFLEYCKESQEIFPVKFSDGTLMTKEDVLTVIKGLENYLENSLTDEEINEFNLNRIEAYREELERDDSNKSTSSSSRMKEEGYVYFVQEPVFGRTKIGKAKKLDERVSRLEIVVPYNLEVVAAIFSKDYSLTEKLLHEKYKEKRVKGEWFDLSEEDISEITMGNFDAEVKNSISGIDDGYE